MNLTARYLALVTGIVLSFFAQQPPRATPKAALLKTESPSTVSLTAKGDEQTLEIHNVTYEVTGDYVPGRPQGKRLLLRQTTCSKQVLGDKGEEATTILEAWPLGVDLKQKPIYTVNVSGTGGRTLNGALFIADRGLEEVEWWSIYRLGTGQHMFDTYVPLVSFSISKQVMELRYVGLEVPPDDTSDARLKSPNVVAVLSYASEERVKWELLLTCDDPEQALILRSYWDTERTMSVTAERPPRALNIAFRSNDQSSPPPTTVNIPLAADDLDLAHARMPSSLHLTPWKR